MQRALSVAKTGVFITPPNPSVGCVLVNHGKVIGEGVTSATGGAHAEINAINAARAKRPDSLIGATVYVTLEPCSHFGRTPPCVNALIDAKVSRVVIGAVDPNPAVSGRGIAKLREAGIDVVSVPETHPLFQACEHHHRGFFKRMRTGLPFVTLKLATSIDGRIATQTGHSQWISGAASRLDVHRQRAQSCAILTSSATVLADNPRLTARLPNEASNKTLARQPLRVIVDRTLSVPVEANVFAPAERVLVYHDKHITPIQRYPEHVELIGLSQDNVQSSKINLRDVCADLATRAQVNHLFIEAGAGIAGTLLSEDLVDELVIYQAPILLGHQAHSAFTLHDVLRVGDGISLCLQECGRIGDDLKMVFTRRERCSQE